MVSLNNIMSVLAVLVLASDRGANCESDDRHHVKDPDTIDAHNPGVTMVPTKIPTQTPTENPTEQPSRKPTDSPTRQPTAAPTRTPTARPSLSPSSPPTASPSFAPSKSPTNQPTFFPSSRPSSIPSVDPTNEPSSFPSSSPSPSPTKIQSSTPSALPSAVPSYHPSYSPSAAPSGSPTINPSAAPSASPMPSQVYEPSASPSKSPIPSQIPSQTPSLPPSELPSLAPSSLPTTSPTEYCIDVAKDFDSGNVSYCGVVYYTYEIETSPNTTLETLEDDIIPAVEQGISNTLLPLVVGECAEDEGVRKLMAHSRGLQSRHRELEIFGVSSSPEDVRPEQAVGECQFQSSVDNECSVIFGGLTICATTLAADKVVVLDAIEAAMDGDEYVDVHDEVVKVHFVSSDVDGAILPGNPTNSSKSTWGATAGLSPSYWGILVGGSVGMIVFIFAGRRMLGDYEDEVEEEDENGGSDTISGQDNV